MNLVPLPPNGALDLLPLKHGAEATLAGVIAGDQVVYLVAGINRGHLSPIFKDSSVTGMWPASISTLLVGVADSASFPTSNHRS